MVVIIIIFAVTAKMMVVFFIPQEHEGTIIYTLACGPRLEAEQDLFQRVQDLATSPENFGDAAQWNDVIQNSAALVGKIGIPVCISLF